MESAQEYHPVNSSVSSDLFFAVGGERCGWLGACVQEEPIDISHEPPLRLPTTKHAPRRQPKRQGQQDEGQVVDGHAVQVHRRLLIPPPSFPLSVLLVVVLDAAAFMSCCCCCRRVNTSEGRPYLPLFVSGLKKSAPRCFW